MPANLNEIVDDLTGQLSQAGSGNGARTQSDQYMQSMAKPSGPVSPSYAPQQAQPQPPSRSAMPPPMDPAASMQQAQLQMQQAVMQQQAMEGQTMRPPYTQPYSQMAYATQPGFQGASMNPLQMPVWQTNDACLPPGAASAQVAAMSPAAQMQMLKQQKMAQLQAQQQAMMAQSAAAQAGQACLRNANGKKSKNGAMSSGFQGTDTERLARLQFWLIVIALIILVVFGIVLIVRGYQNAGELHDIQSTLRSPVGG